jgi:hypothetical protein
VNGLGLFVASETFARGAEHMLRAAEAYSEAWKAQRAAMETLRQANRVLAVAAARGELPPRVAQGIEAIAASLEGSQILEVPMDAVAQRELARETKAMEDTAREALRLSETLRRLGGGEA